MTLYSENQYLSADGLANLYLKKINDDSKVEYPINPFAFLKKEGIVFSFSNFNKLEGVYIPASDNNDVPLIGININRPITRQRYTAAHELCHHLRDSSKQVSCQIGSKTKDEMYAEDFAAALLMPISELKKQVDKRKDSYGKVGFDDVLEIADYFGVSFLSCLYRIAYRIHAIEGNIDSQTLRKNSQKYKPDKKRKERHMTYANLYADVIDCYGEQFSFVPNDHARYLFQNEYIYNDSRLEGVDIDIEKASEIVTDLRLNRQSSEFCNEENEAFLSIAGHYEMYQQIFSTPTKESLSVYDALPLNRILFSFYPHSEEGTSTRQNNTLVMGAKFETIDYNDIFPELAKVDIQIKEYYAERNNMSKSEYIKHVVRTHHRLTVIHPFSDGNGRTLRAFMNVQLVRASLPPIYIKVEDKSIYFDALSLADRTGQYDELYELIFKIILSSHVSLKKE